MGSMFLEHMFTVRSPAVASSVFGTACWRKQASAWSLPNCSKEHLGTETRVSPPPTVQHLFYQGPTKELAWEPTSQS